MAEQTQSGDKQVQGEGDRKAARRYNEASKKFAESGKVKEAAEKAGTQSEKTSREAEKAGKSRARELDPEVHRDYSKPTGR